MNDDTSNLSDSAPSYGTYDRSGRMKAGSGGSAAARPPKRPRRPGRRIRWARLVAVVAALAVVIGGIVVYRDGGFKAAVMRVAAYGAGQVPNKHMSVAPPPRPDDPLTVLVMSTENAPDYAGPQLTDSMMVWSYDPATKKASMLSVPRDLWVDIPGYGYNRINAALLDGGPKTVMLTVERYVGVPIQYYAIVDYKAFQKLVNDVGGIDVDNPYNIDDSCYPNVLENKCTVFRLSPGMHHMDGALALKFARERHTVPQGDITREADQQLVLFALKDALLKPANLLHVGSIIGDMHQLITTDLPYSALPKLADEVVHLPKSSINHGVLDYKSGSVTNFTTKGGAEVLLPHPTAIAKVVQSLFAPVLAHMGEATVQVENGAPTQQPYATYFSGVLQGMGVTTLQPRQAAQTDYTENEVIWNTAAADHGADPPTLAYILARMLDTKITRKAMPGSQAPIVVMLGSPFPHVQP